MLELARPEESALTLATPEEQVLARMETARAQLAAARTLGEAKRVADGAAAIYEWLRRQSELGLEIVNDAQLLKIQAEARMGEFLKRPGVVKTEPGRVSLHAATIPVATYEEIGISRFEAKRCREVSTVPQETLRDLADKATRSGRELTRKSVLKVAARLKPPAVVLNGNGHSNGHGPATELPSGIPAPLCNQVVTGDARDLARQLPAESVALCFCDPVYDRIEDYAWVARECERVLIPGGNLIVQCGNLRRFQCETEMRRSALEFVDLLAEVYPYALCPLYPIRVQVGWKPYLWFSKGPRRGEWVMNRVHAKGKQHAHESKDLHPWGDAEQFAAGLLEKLCSPGDVVWDPFTGSGLVPVVAKRLGLSFVAFEVDAEAAELARQRLAGTRRAVSPQCVLPDAELVEV